MGSKCGTKGVYQHCSEKHLHRYLAEFEFRYSNRVALGVNDEARVIRALKGVTGNYQHSHFATAEWTPAETQKTTREWNTVGI
jgi:hypothetical protein